MNMLPPEENVDLPGFHPERAHLLLQGVYGDFPYHNNGSHLDRGISDDAAWQRCWRRIASQSASFNGRGERGEQIGERKGRRGPKGGTGRGHSRWGECHPPRGKRGPSGIHP